MPAAPTNRDSDKFMLRLPDGMRDRIAQAAKSNGRSMNAEIIQKIEDAFALEKQVAELAIRSDTMHESLVRIAKAIDDLAPVIERLAQARATPPTHEKGSAQF